MFSTDYRRNKFLYNGFFALRAASLFVTRHDMWLRRVNAVDKYYEISGEDLQLSLSRQFVAAADAATTHTQPLTAFILFFFLFGWRKQIMSRQNNVSFFNFFFFSSLFFFSQQQSFWEWVCKCVNEFGVHTQYANSWIDKRITWKWIYPHYHFQAILLLFLLLIFVVLVFIVVVVTVILRVIRHGARFKKTEPKKKSQKQH